MKNKIFLNTRNTIGTDSFASPPPPLSQSSTVHNSWPMSCKDLTRPDPLNHTQQRLARSCVRHVLQKRTMRHNNKYRYTHDIIFACGRVLVVEYWNLFSPVKRPARWKGKMRFISRFIVGSVVFPERFINFQFRWVIFISCWFFYRCSLLCRCLCPSPIVGPAPALCASVHFLRTDDALEVLCCTRASVKRINKKKNLTTPRL